MTGFNLYPSLVFLFAGTNLASWYFRGHPLFSWWWLILVIAVEVIFQSLTLAIAKKMVELRK